MKMRYLLPALAAAAVLGISACGGGGGSSSQTGTMNVAVTDGPSDEFLHVWVTIKAIAFHTDPNAAWSTSDASWQLTTLPSPVTIDLTQLNNGALNNLFSGINLPAGTYKQIRFFLNSAESSLQTSAFDTLDSNGDALQWNDQVEYVNVTAGTGGNPPTFTYSEAPLEIAYPVQGIQLQGTFNLAAGATMNLAVDFDLEHDIVAFNHDSGTMFTMRPNLQYFDLSTAAAISGQVEPSSLCPSITAQVTQSTPCAFNLIVKAELPNSATSATRHVVIRQTSVDPATGNFTLYPLPTVDAAGNTISHYDLILRGRNMETMLVTSVPVTAGTTVGGTGSSTPTQVPPISASVNSGEYTAQLATPLSPLTGGFVIFEQAPQGSTLPYEIRWRHVDPFTGLFRNPIYLQGASSQLLVGAYNSTAVSFTGGPPAEGQGNFTVADNEVAYYTLGTSSTYLQAPSSGTSATFAPAVPTLNSGVQDGTVTVNLSFSNISVDNNCEFVLVRFATIIDTVNCSSMLSTYSTPGPNSGTFQITGVGAGDSADPVLGAYYYAYVRLWETGTGFTTRKIVPLPGFINLIQQTSATVNGSIVGS